MVRETDPFRSENERPTQKSPKFRRPTRRARRDQWTARCSKVCPITAAQNPFPRVWNNLQIQTRRPTWVRRAMNGSELRDQRRRLGFTQDDLISELGIRSRQTLISWEKSDGELPRLVELAMLPQERIPECHQKAGKKTPARDRQAFKRKVAATG